MFYEFFYNNKNLIDVKFPKKEFHNIYWFYNMFNGCEKLTSIDMSNVYNDNAGDYNYMFYGCKNLEQIIIPKFIRKYSGSQKQNLFYNVPKNVTLLINQAFYESIQEQLTDFESVFRYN